MLAARALADALAAHVAALLATQPHATMLFEPSPIVIDARSAIVDVLAMAARIWPSVGAGVAGGVAGGAGALAGAAAGPGAEWWRLLGAAITVAGGTGGDAWALLQHRFPAPVRPAVGLMEINFVGTLLAREAMAFRDEARARGQRDAALGPLTVARFALEAAVQRDPGHHLARAELCACLEAMLPTASPVYFDLDRHNAVVTRMDASTPRLVAVRAGAVARARRLHTTLAYLRPQPPAAPVKGRGRLL